MNEEAFLTPEERSEIINESDLSGGAVWRLTITAVEPPIQSRPQLFRQTFASLMTFKPSLLEKEVRLDKNSVEKSVLIRNIYSKVYSVKK